MPGSSKRAANKGSGTRRQGARPAARRARGRDQAAARRVGWSRRVGIAAAFVLLIGAGIAFAGGAFNGAEGARPQPPAQAERPNSPTLIAPAVSLTSQASIEVAGTLPADPRRGAPDSLRVYVNGEVARQRAVPQSADFTVDVPLEEGDNVITAALVGDAGESQLAPAITVVRDSTAPVIRITSPGPGSTVYGATATLRGRTEPGASIEIRPDGASQSLDSTVAADGAFEALVDLVKGANTFVLRSVDAAGNRSTERLEIVRGTSLASINLSVSVAEIALADLPTSVDLLALVRDENGRAADGAEVTFSLSPPNRGTTTYRATTVDGDARWTRMPVTGDNRALGTWLVTVLAVLPSGEELRASADFSVR